MATPLEWLEALLFGPKELTPETPEEYATSVNPDLFPPQDPNADASYRQMIKARRDLALMLGIPLVVIPAVPAIYAITRGKASRRGKRASVDESIGVSLENASNASATLLQTIFASPVIATAFAYIAVQKAETGKLITKGLGDAVQSLMAISAAGPAIQGVTNVFSAFAKKGK